VIIDTSAIVAILKGEPEAPRFANAIQAALTRRISAGSLLEAAIVVDGNEDPVLSRRLDEVVERASITIEPVTLDQVRIGRQAYRDFGKGSRHPANLNFGDCFAYALAKATGEPLLFKGNDFSHTDIKPAL
jgi:ribonuclease VapC